VSRAVPVEWPPETLDAFGPEFVAWMDACQRRPVGGAPPPIPAGLVGGAAAQAATVEGLRAFDALLAILATADGPVEREAVARHPDWRFGVTSTLTGALRKGQDVQPALVVKVPGGKARFALTSAGREHVAQAQAALREHEQLVLAEESAT
jgi:hypothetical protein